MRSAFVVEISSQDSGSEVIGKNVLLTLQTSPGDSISGNTMTDNDGENANRHIRPANPTILLIQNMVSSFRRMRANHRYFGNRLENREFNATSTAFYAQGAYYFIHSIGLTIDGRWTTEEKEFKDSPVGITGLQFDDSRSTWRTAIEYGLSDDL